MILNVAVTDEGTVSGSQREGNRYFLNCIGYHNLKICFHGDRQIKLLVTPLKMFKGTANRILLNGAETGTVKWVSLVSKDQHALSSWSFHCSCTLSFKKLLPLKTSHTTVLYNTTFHDSCTTLYMNHEMWGQTTGYP